MSKCIASRMNSNEFGILCNVNHSVFEYIKVQSYYNSLPNYDLAFIQRLQLRTRFFQ